MARFRKSQHVEKEQPDATELLKKLGKAYATATLSPVARLERISRFADENRFRVYALTLAQKFAEHMKHKELDRVFDRPNRIDLGQADRWVSNTRALTENTVRAQLTEYMVMNILPALGPGELAEEVWSVLKEPYETILRQKHTEHEQSKQAQSAASHGIGGVNGAPTMGPQQKP